MAKSKKTGKKEIIDAYMDYVLEHHDQPKSMHQFASMLKMKEADLYDHFASFTSIEQSIFLHFFEHTMALLDKDPSFEGYDARNKLISFYFTFFEMLKVNRSYVVYSLDKKHNFMESMRALETLKMHFKKFVAGLDINGLELKKERLEKIQKMGMQGMAWNQFMLTLKFWLNDTSSGFEKTDIFIEKSLNAGFDLINTQPLESLIDLGKFLFQEKMAMR